MGCCASREKSTICRYLQAHSTDVIEHATIRLETAVPWILNLGDAFGLLVLHLVDEPAALLALDNSSRAVRTALESATAWRTTFLHFLRGIYSDCLLLECVASYECGKPLRKEYAEAGFTLVCQMPPEPRFAVELHASCTEVEFRRALLFVRSRCSSYSRLPTDRQDLQIDTCGPLRCWRLRSPRQPDAPDQLSSELYGPTGSVAVEEFSIDCYSGARASRWWWFVPRAEGVEVSTCVERGKHLTVHDCERRHLHAPRDWSEPRLLTEAQRRQLAAALLALRGGMRRGSVSTARRSVAIWRAAPSAEGDDEPAEASKEEEFEVNGGCAWSFDVAARRIVDEEPWVLKGRLAQMPTRVEIQGDVVGS